MKKLLLFLVVAAPLCCAAQKVEVNKDKIMVDEAEYAIIEKDSCGAFSETCEFNIKNLAGKKLL